MSKTEAVKCNECICRVQNRIMFRRARRPTGCSRRERRFITVIDENNDILRRRRGCCNGYIDVEYDQVPDILTSVTTHSIEHSTSKALSSAATSVDNQVSITTMENISKRQNSTTEVYSKTLFTSTDMYTNTAYTTPVEKEVVPTLDMGGLGAVIGVVAAASALIIILFIFLGLCFMSKRRSTDASKKRHSPVHANTDNSTDTMLHDDESDYYSTIHETGDKTTDNTSLQQTNTISKDVLPHSNDYFVLEVDPMMVKTHNEIGSSVNTTYYNLSLEENKNRCSQMYDTLRENEKPEEVDDMYSHIQNVESEYDLLNIP